MISGADSFFLFSLEVMQSAWVLMRYSPNVFFSCDPEYSKVDNVEWDAVNNIKQSTLKRDI